MTAQQGGSGKGRGLRRCEEIPPSEIFADLVKGVLGQDEALRYVSVAVYKHTTGKLPGNILLIGSSGTGKTTIMNNIQRLYRDVPEYAPFRAITIINANLLVDGERFEFRPDRLLTAVEQRARAILDHPPTSAELKEVMERATVCVDEIDKMSTVLGGKPNPIGVVLQQGLLTLMEGDVVPFRTHVIEDGEERERFIEIDTGHMMFICGGAFEGLYDQVYYKVTSPGSGEKLRSTAVRTADGQVRLELRVALRDFFAIEDLFQYGLVPQFTARFDQIVLLSDLGMDVLKEILLHSLDSPFLRSRRFLELLGITLEMDSLAAALIAEQAEKHSRTGARALRSIFGKVSNPFEFDPESSGLVEKVGGGKRLIVTAELVRKALNL